jgi:hypothetical protein
VKYVDYRNRSRLFPPVWFSIRLQYVSIQSLHTSVTLAGEKYRRPGSRVIVLLSVHNSSSEPTALGDLLIWFVTAPFGALAHCRLAIHSSFLSGHAFESQICSYV